MSRIAQMSEDPIEIQENPLTLKAPVQKTMDNLPSQEEEKKPVYEPGNDPCICCMYACFCCLGLLGFAE